LETIFSADVLTDAKHSALSTNNLPYRDKNKQNYNQDEQHKNT